MFVATTPKSGKGDKGVNLWLLCGSSLVILTSFSWLIPNHYPPWLAAWNDGVAIGSLLLLAVIISFENINISWQLPAVAVICVATVLMQLTAGKLLFSGDAIVVVLYLLVWLTAVLSGRFLVKSSWSPQLLSALAIGWCLTATLSVGIALTQWTGSVSLNIYGPDLPPGGRPFANVAQPNHFCTICFIGLCGLLYLCENKVVRRSVFYLAAAFLLVGMAASRSRTGWLQIALLVAWGLFMQGRAASIVSKRQLLFIGAFFVAGAMCWPSICDILMLSNGGRSLDGQMQAGVRFPYWLSMLDAAVREPFWGYGWAQIGSAQLRVALDHPPVGALFDHSHNFLLDFVLWNGPLIGGIAIAILVSWFASQIRSCRSGRLLWFLAAIGGCCVHGLLEYPLAYAYFLVPVGLAMGIVEESSTTRWHIRLSPWLLRTFAALLGGLFLWVAADYLKIEEEFRDLRFELARIGPVRQENRDKGEHTLNQLAALMKFYRTEARPGMETAELAWMRKISLRYAYPPVLLRMALAEALNERPDSARETLALLCQIHAPRRCQEARDSWAILQERYPQLMQVTAPETARNWQ